MTKEKKIFEKGLEFLETRQPQFALDCFRLVLKTVPESDPLVPACCFQIALTERRQYFQGHTLYPWLMRVLKTLKSVSNPEERNEFRWKSLLHIGVWLIEFYDLDFVETSEKKIKAAWLHFTNFTKPKPEEKEEKLEEKKRNWYQVKEWHPAYLAILLLQCIRNSTPFPNSAFLSLEKAARCFKTVQEQSPLESKDRRYVATELLLAFYTIHFSGDLKTASLILRRALKSSPNGVLSELCRFSLFLCNPEEKEEEKHTFFTCPILSKNLTFRDAPFVEILRLLSLGKLKPKKEKPSRQVDLVFKAHKRQRLNQIFGNDDYFCDSFVIINNVNSARFWLRHRTKFQEREAECKKKERKQKDQDFGKELYLKTSPGFSKIMDTPGLLTPKEIFRATKLLKKLGKHYQTILTESQRQIAYLEILNFPRFYSFFLPDSLKVQEMFLSSLHNYGMKNALFKFEKVETLQLIQVNIDNGDVRSLAPLFVNLERLTLDFIEFKSADARENFFSVVSQSASLVHLCFFPSESEETYFNDEQEIECLLLSLARNKKRLVLLTIGMQSDADEEECEEEVEIKRICRIFGKISFFANSLWQAQLIKIFVLQLAVTKKTLRSKQMYGALLNLQNALGSTKFKWRHQKDLIDFVQEKDIHSVY